MLFEILSRQQCPLTVYNAHRAKMQQGYYVRADPRPRHAFFLSNLKHCIFQGVKNGPAMLHGASGATRKGKHFLIRHKQKQKMKKIVTYAEKQET